MAPKAKISFETNVNKRVTAVIGQMRALAKLGPRCTNPAHAETVRSVIAAELDALHTAWKEQKKPTASGFSL